ncbi:MAG: succinylglutamate desuccinylase/aspartoacylase family protein [Planctomycetia bacterium]|nr:succinylglutamate desuccinylase/aspartoacylase family protein [Planctomycetia bacterium]
MQLKQHTIAGRQARPHLLITGGVHGDEFEPMAAIRRLIREISAGNIRGQVTLVPVVNEPAFERGQRTADDGLDLARTCPGRADGTMTERIAAALSALIRDSDYYIDLHTGGTRLVVQPLVGYGLHRNRDVLAAQRRMARAFGLPIIWGTDPSLDGRSLSVARDANVPAIYAEYLGGGGCSAEGVKAYVSGCLNVLIELGILEGEIAAAANNPIVVEDERPGAGHMQVNHPAPCEGFFEPAVRLGQRVESGATLGTVCDVIGDTIMPIVANYTGLVLVLHTFSRVNAGDGVAVILPADRMSV